MATLTHPIIAVAYPVTGTGIALGSASLMNHNLQRTAPFAGFGTITGTLAIGSTQVAAARTVRL